MEASRHFWQLFVWHLQKPTYSLCSSGCGLELSSLGWPMALCFSQSFSPLSDKQNQSETLTSMIPLVNLRKNRQMKTRTKISKDMSPSRIHSLTDLVKNMRCNSCKICSNKIRCHRLNRCSRCKGCNRCIRCSTCNSRGVIYRLVSQSRNNLLQINQSPKTLMIDRLAKMNSCE